MTESDDFFLITNEYKQPILINSNNVLYKASYRDRYDSEGHDDTINFVHKRQGPKVLEAENDDYVYSTSDSSFKTSLIEYVNGLYLRTGIYLLILGFSLQIVDI